MLSLMVVRQEILKKQAYSFKTISLALSCGRQTVGNIHCRNVYEQSCGLIMLLPLSQIYISLLQILTINSGYSNLYSY